MATGMSEVCETGPFSVHDWRHITKGMEVIKKKKNCSCKFC
jgi:hypothetical protein